MTVQELIAQLETLPPDATVVAQFDVSDADTHWAVYEVADSAIRPGVVIIKAA